MAWVGKKKIKKDKITWYDNFIYPSIFHVILMFPLFLLKNIVLFLVKHNTFKNILKYNPYLKGIRKVQKYYYKKRVELLTGELEYRIDTIPTTKYAFKDNTLLLQCFFDDRVVETDYERLRDEIIMRTGMMCLNSYTEKGFYYIELAIKEEDSTQAVFIDLKEPYKIPVGMQYGRVVYWEFNKYPHGLIVGITGSGKSVFMRYLLSSIFRLYEVDCIDGKEVDYIKYATYFNKYTGVMDKEKAIQMIKDFHTEMRSRYNKMKEKLVEDIYELDDDDLKPKFLLIDEFTSFIESLEETKQLNERKEVLKLVGDIARLGRACGLILLLAMQRPDTKYILGETRGNFNLKAVLGATEDETYRMMFNTTDFEKVDTGQGYIQIKNKIQYVKLPYVKKIELGEKEENIE